MGRPKKGQEPPKPPPTRLELQPGRSLAENLADLPRVCDSGCKKGSQGQPEYWQGYKAMHDKIGGERGWPPMERASFNQEVERGALHVGSPETVARKIVKTAKALGIVRFDLKYSAGTLAHDKLMHCIELYGSKVMPMVREMLMAVPAV